MPLLTTLAQGSLAAAILASAAGTYLAISPPNPNKESVLSTGDGIHWLNLTHKNFTKVVLVPLSILSAQASSLACTYPNLASSAYRSGADARLNTNLITWSTATAVPLGLMLCAGIPLRLGSYSSLGKNFTFALSKPDCLKTDGIYRYLQHPSYTGLIILVTCNIALLARTDGAISCWVSPERYDTFRCGFWLFTLTALSGFFFGVRTRVRQEESMLKAEFKEKWEEWHSRTARFIPWIF